MKGGYIVTEAIYKVGDILEIVKMYGMFPGSDKTRCLVLKCIHPGYEFIIYSLLIYKSDDSFTVMGINQKEIICSARKVGHIDISKLLSDDESAEPDYAMFFTAATIAQAADLRNELDKIKKENVELKAENKTLLDKNEVLKRENEELRGYNEKLDQALLKSKEKADFRFDRITFLTHKVDELENVSKKLQANLAEETLKRKQAEAELNEKAEELDKVYHSDIVCENNKLRNENKILNEIVNDFKSTCANCEARSENEKLKTENRENKRLNNENKNLKAMNDELRSSWIDCCTSCKQTEENKKLMDENAKLSLKLHDANEKIRKLEEENGKLAQKISCADNLLAEAANRLYQGRAHLNISAHN